MGRKDCVASFAGLAAAAFGGLAALLLIGLLLGCLGGCSSQAGAPRWADRQMRPASDTARLVQNAAYLKRTGRLELALAELEEANLREPENLELLDLLIQTYEDLGDFDRAQELYQKALSRGGHHPALENNRCFSLYLQGRLEQAEACFRKILSRQPDNQTARNNLGLALCRQGRETEALAMWREGLSDVEARGRLGQALAALGKEVPPSLAVPLPRPATPSSPPPQAASPPATPDPDMTLASLPDTIKPGDRKKPVATPPPPPEKPVATVVSPVRSASLAEPPAPREPAAGVEPTPSAPRIARVAPAAPVASDAQAGKAPAAASVPSARPANNQAASFSPKLTADDLLTTRIELKNGNGAKNQAKETRSLLALEGLTVVGVGNHIDFGLDETSIAFRPEAAKVAQLLAQKFFPEAKLEPGGSVSPGADIRVSLGRDCLAEGHISRKLENTPMATKAAPPPAVERAPAAAPLPKVSKTPASPPSGAQPRASLAVPELNQVGIELKNGNGVQGQARELRSRMTLEGFTVVGIGNHIDFGLEKTIIAHRPEATRVAQALSKKFFPGAILELQEDDQFSAQAAVRVSLGRDLISGQERQVAQAAP
jgi:Tfp pilus assembly protein PilF/transcriptional antiterminator Rof (Rho-off)